MTKDKYGIIDIGSNTMRLVIYKRNNSGRYKELENVKSVSRLRNYLSNEFILHKDGITTLIKTLQSFLEVIKHHQLTEMKCVATATIRIAQNQDEILKTVKEQTGFNIEILSEYQEAFYGYLAVINSTSFNSGITVDIGGGSTELTYFHDRKLINYHSFPFGALSLKRQFISGSKPTLEELHKLKEYITEQFSSLDWLLEKELPIIGIGGSARNLAQIHQECIGYPISGAHQYTMTKQEVDEMQQFLANLTFPELQRVEGLSRDRADIILPAVEVFKCLLELVHSNQFILSRKGLRDGIFYNEKVTPAGEIGFPNVLEESFLELSREYDIDVEHNLAVSKNAIKITELLNSFGITNLNDHDIDRMKRAALVFNLGDYIDSESSSQHTFYLLANRTIDGLSHKERVAIALIASFKSKAVFKRYVTLFEHWFSKEELTTYRLIGAILKFAHSLNATKRKIVHYIDLSIDNDELIFSITSNKNWTPEQYQIEKQKKHLEKHLKKLITVNFKEQD
ncbi:Ppx/GppA family phosphatase [Litchfieldia salsa]|uniref:Exopolyphosphatase / guanosine-5'-triphosphate,3'-diphosphate pyrophosphatase n=1 Tax=Litchfieldia salsa TaxID=930152 RepID=A0A1H0VYA9_9BACI|nr:Ppx/GppA family phosphatase [Litchfieldia salsa]SDP83311.1 exopolyphosphatase / guanosine-5'-triphosphate,3'-diphosphate pyrophosphatase [Litchfieldia salsa]